MIVFQNKKGETDWFLEVTPSLGVGKRLCEPRPQNRRSFLNFGSEAQWLSYGRKFDPSLIAKKGGNWFKNGKKHVARIFLSLSQ